jgi:hypothetical protein
MVQGVYTGLSRVSRATIWHEACGWNLPEAWEGQEQGGRPGLGFMTRLDCYGSGKLTDM